MQNPLASSAWRLAKTISSQGASCAICGSNEDERCCFGRLWSDVSSIPALVDLPAKARSGILGQDARGVQRSCPHVENGSSGADRGKSRWKHLQAQALVSHVSLVIMNNLHLVQCDKQQSSSVLATSPFDR